MMHDFELRHPGSGYKLYRPRNSRLMGRPLYIPPPERSVVHRGMTEIQAKQAARGMTKSKKHPGRYRAERCGRSWDVIRSE